MSRPDRPAGFVSISSVRALPERVAELSDWFTVRLECARCDRFIQIYPSPAHHYAPGLRIPAMLTGHSCGACGLPFSHLVLELAGRGIPFDTNNQTGQWVLDRAGAWTERRGEFWGDFDYDRKAILNAKIQQAEEELRALRLKDVAPDEVIVFTCGAQRHGSPCRHAKMLSARDLIRAGVGLEDKITPLAGRARCRRCGKRSARTSVHVQRGRS